MARVTRDIVVSNAKLKAEAQKRRTEYNERRENDRVSSGGGRNPFIQPRGAQVSSTQEDKYKHKDAARQSPKDIGERVKQYGKQQIAQQLDATREREREERLAATNERADRGSIESIRARKGDQRRNKREQLNRRRGRLGESLNAEKDTEETTTEPAVEEPTQEETQVAEEEPATEPAETEEPAATDADKQVEAKQRAQQYKQASNNDEILAAFR